MKNNIVLIGFMGCGKTTIGNNLAKVLDFSFVDTDEKIEKDSQKTINEIFAAHGEEYFRNLETKTIEKMAKEAEKTVISTGGGLPLREVNADILKRTGFVVYLRVQGKTVEKRLQGDKTRPLLQGGNVSEKITNLLNFRDPIYEYGAHMVLDVDDKTVEEIIEDIKRNFWIFAKVKQEQSCEETEEL